MQWGPDTLARIRQVPHFRDSHYVDLDIPATLDYFKRRFVDHCPLRRAEMVIADIGCGYGWLAMAFAAHCDARIFAIDPDGARLEAGREIASLLGVASRIEWRVGSLSDIPLGARQADATYCIEVLEHIDRDASAFSELDRVTAGYIVLTTPNGAFPVVQHDTRLPFCHWLPLHWRNFYSRLAGRRALQDNNRFWYPWDLSRHLSNFRRVSGFLHFDRVDDYFALYPYYLPYGSGEWRRAPSSAMSRYFRLAARFGRHSHLVLHTLAGTFVRAEATSSPRSLAASPGVKNRS